MRDVFGDGVFAADLSNANIGGLARFGEGIVARVEVFAFLGKEVTSVSSVREAMRYSHGGSWKQRAVSIQLWYVLWSCVAIQ